MIKAVIFDFDDTLTMTEEIYFRIGNEVLRRMNRKPVNRAVHKTTWTKPVDIAIVECSSGIDVKKFRSIFNAVRDKFIDDGLVDVVPDIHLNVLDALAKNGKQIMILTSRSQEDIKHFLDTTHPLAGRVSMIYHRDNNMYLKPDGRVFNVMELEHGLKPNECVYVGDALSDAEAAKGAGLYFIATLESGLRQKTDFNNYMVDEFINKLPEVIKAIENIEARLVVLK